MTPFNSILFEGEIIGIKEPTVDGNTYPELILRQIWEQTQTDIRVWVHPSIWKQPGKTAPRIGWTARVVGMLMYDSPSKGYVILATKCEVHMKSYEGGRNEE